MTVLQERGPRLLGGRDHLAGGTWLAVSEYGVVAGLTNQPSMSVAPGIPPCSRGELPLMFAAYPVCGDRRGAGLRQALPRRTTWCWLLVGDRQALFGVGLAGGTAPEVRELLLGQYVLENVPLDPPSQKAARIGAEPAGRRRWPGTRRRPGRPARTGPAGARCARLALASVDEATLKEYPDAPGRCCRDAPWVVVGGKPTARQPSRAALRRDRRPGGTGDYHQEQPGLQKPRRSSSSLMNWDIATAAACWLTSGPTMSLRRTDRVSGTSARTGCRRTARPGRSPGCPWSGR